MKQFKVPENGTWLGRSGNWKKEMHLELLTIHELLWSSSFSILHVSHFVYLLPCYIIIMVSFPVYTSSHHVE